MVFTRRASKSVKRSAPAPKPAEKGAASHAQGKSSTTLPLFLRPPVRETLEREADRFARGASDRDLGAMDHNAGPVISSPGEAARPFAPAAARPLPPAPPAEDARPLLAELGGGLPLDEAARAHFQPLMAVDLGAVRVHTGSSASSVVAGLGARAFAAGPHLVFHHSEHSAHSPEGRRLLGHELAHVEMAARAPSMAPAVQCDDGVTVLVILEAPDPFYRYTELQAALPPDDFRRLNNAARRRGYAQRQRLGLPVDPTESASVALDASNEVDVPLQALLRPRLPSTESGDFRDRLFEEASRASPRQEVLASIISAEMVRVWLEWNPTFLDLPVTVGLIDPEGRGDDEPGLTFQLEGEPIPTLDGALYVQQVDVVLNGALDQVVFEVSEAAEAVGEVAALSRLCDEAIRRGRWLIDQGHERTSPDDLRAWSGVLTDLQARLNAGHDAPGDVGHLLDQVMLRFDAYVTSEARPYEQEHERWFAEHQPELSYGEQSMGRMSRALEYQEQLMEEGGFLNYLAAGSWGETAYYEAVGYGTANLFTAGYVETSRQFHEAFRGGHISLADFEQGLDQAATRAWIVGGITVALTVATFGLAGPVLGPSASLGSQVLYWGGSAAITTMSAMTAESLYTRATPLSGGMAQQIWGQGAYSPGQILLGGAISFGLGSAGPILGWLGNRGNAAVVRELAIASARGGEVVVPELGSGLSARVIEPGVVEISHATSPGIVRVTREGWRLVMPAGNGTETIMSRAWGEALSVPPELLERAPALSTLRFQVGELGGEQLAYGVNERGWFMYPERTRVPQFGMWPEPELLGATSPGTSLVPGRFVTPFGAPFEPLGPPGIPMLPGQTSMWGAGTSPWMLEAGPPGPLMLPAGSPFVGPTTQLGAGGPTIIVARQLPMWSPTAETDLALATEAVIQRDLARSQALSRYASLAGEGGLLPEQVADLTASLSVSPEALAGEALLRERGLIVVYRGQRIDTRLSSGGPGVLSPVARTLPEGVGARLDLTGVDRSRFLFEQLTTGRYTGAQGPMSPEDLARNTAFYSGQELPPSYLGVPISPSDPYSLIDPRIGGMGIPSTSLPGITTGPEFAGPQGPVMVIRIPAQGSTPVPNWALGLEQEVILWHEVPESSIYRLLSPGERPSPLTISPETSNLIIPPRR